MAETKRTILERLDQGAGALRAQLEALTATVSGLRELLVQVAADVIQVKNGVTMANAQITQLISDFNSETNAIGARIDRLIAGLTDVATPEQVAELRALSDRLTTLGQDPTTPIPPAT